MNTIAVGPLELGVFCVAGGKDRNLSALLRGNVEVIGVLVSLEVVDCEALFVSRLMGLRRVILMMLQEVEDTGYELQPVSDAKDVSCPGISNQGTGMINGGVPQRYR